MGRLILTGDVHGELLKRFSYKNDGRLRELTKDDSVMVLGDFGCPFGVNHPQYEQHYKNSDNYQLQWMQSRPWKTTFALLGNHDDRDALRQMNVVEMQGYMFPHWGNIIYIDKPCILDIAGNHCLLIPGAKSHDAKFRTMGIDMWPDEGIDIIAAIDTLIGHRYDYFDLILTHDVPSGNLYHFMPTVNEEFLEYLAGTLNYGAWYHGHMHNQYCKLERDITCLYGDIIDPNDPKW